eukprot:CAMPEP_0117504202 /NCGR_PEP_ID=MMETSP0784-20121206/24728_1 /TAXON_ID=39447 /ORGANISM="" /LENGTH=50 /DNA_ID=CAMNT_0005299551 /DNA_START=866 /DNA_END=1015 /DNA_ORIENTATION=-
MTNVQPGSSRTDGRYLTQGAWRTTLLLAQRNEYRKTCTHSNAEKKPATGP